MCNKVAITFFFLVHVASPDLLPRPDTISEDDMSSLMNHMATMEQTMSQLQSQVLQTSTELSYVKTKLRTTESELSTVKSELMSVRKDIHTTDLELSSVKTELRNTEIGMVNLGVTINGTDVTTWSECQNFMSEINARVTGISDNVSSIMRALASTTEISFQATQSSDGCCFNLTRHVFDAVDFNHGGDYNTTTGIFKTRVPGYYILWLLVAIDNSTDMLVETWIYKNGHVLAIDSARPKELNKLSVVAVAKLEAADEISFFWTWNITVTRSSHYGGLLLRAV